MGNRHNPYAGLSVEDLYAGLARTRLRRRPGQRVKYSNLGTGLLGQALARAAGQSYEALVHRADLPAAWHARHPHHRHRRAGCPAGHRALPQGQPDGPVPAPRAGGRRALRSTAIDMLCLLRANLDPAHSPLASQLERTQLPRLRAGKRLEVGLGWLIAHPPRAAGPVLWHNGGTSGFRSFVALARETNSAVVVLSNTARSVDRLGLRLLKALTGTPG